LGQVTASPRQSHARNDKGLCFNKLRGKRKNGFMLYPDKTCKNKEKSRKKQSFSDYFSTNF
jgi:hypothetical protein